MKNTQTFLLGALTGAFIVACGGASKPAESGEVQTVKLDGGQLSQLITAVRGADAKYQYEVTEWKYLSTENKNNIGTKGWEVVAMQAGVDGQKPKYLVRKRID